MYNDKPVLEVNGWKILCPNAYGKKYRGLTNPILIHKCNLATIHPNTQEWGEMMAPDRPEGNPHCGKCHDPIPEEIQGLLAMYYWGAEERSDDTALPQAGNTCYKQS